MHDNTYNSFNYVYGLLYYYKKYKKDNLTKFNQNASAIAFVLMFLNNRLDTFYLRGEVYCRLGITLTESETFLLLLWYHWKRWSVSISNNIKRPSRDGHEDCNDYFVHMIKISYCNKLTCFHFVPLLVPCKLQLKMLKLLYCRLALQQTYSILDNDMDCIWSLCIQALMLSSKVITTVAPIAIEHGA